MSVGGRADARRRMVQRSAIAAAVLALVTLLLLASGHWIIGILFAAATAVAVWAFLQLRTLR